MIKKELLENGLLEQYVLGELNAEQNTAIESLIVSDNEVKQKLDAIESDFINLANENAVQPPAFVKTQLLSKIKSTNTIAELSPKNNTRFYLGIAASFAALFLLGSVWLYSELNTIKQQLQIVKDENSTLKNNLKTTTTTLNETNKWYAALSNPNTQQYILKGNTLSPETKIVSYVNHHDKSVIINTEKLAQLDDKHDYQMWADVDGEMIDMGVIPKEKGLIAMTYIEKAESLNVTIELAGGNDHPTVERLITNVYLD